MVVAQQHRATVADTAAPLDDRQHAAANLHVIAGEIAERARWN